MARGSRSVLALLVAGALAACGGGGTSTTPPPTPTPTPVPTAPPPPSTTLWVTGGSTLMRLSNYHSEVDVFPLGASGNANPARQIRVGQSLGIFPTSIAVDDLGNAYMSVIPRLFQVTSPASCGNGCPGSGTSFGQTDAGAAWGIALDSARCVYVSAGTAIEVFSGTIQGGYAKVATIPNGSTNGVAGIAFDGSGNLYAIDSNSFDANNTVAPTIAIFHGATCGGQTFQSAIGGANTQLQLPAQIAFDAAGSLYVTDSAAKAVFVYAPGATGNVAPIRTIAGSNTGFQRPWGVAVDTFGVLHVSDQTANAVFDFPPGANGNVAPSNILTGPPGDQGFNGPLGITTH
jgi:hypothetical protein